MAHRVRCFCHNEDCRDSIERNPTNPRPMVCVGETPSAWQFKCETCGGRHAWTKNFVGGVFGAGSRRDDGTLAFKYQPGWRA